MPGLTGNVHLGARRHVRICRESTFGSVPGAPTWHSIPILEDGWKLKATSPYYRPNTNYGGDYRRHIHIHHRQEVAGDFTTLAWPEEVEFLLGMALDRQANHDIYSYAADYYTPADPRRYVGIVSERLAIAVTGTGDGDVRLTHTLRAKSEAENNTLSEGDFDYSGLTTTPFMFRDASIRINAALRVDVEAFTLTVENNVAQGPARRDGAYLATVQYLIAQQRAISLELTKVNRDDAFNEAIRDGGPFAFEAAFIHPDGHLWQIQLPAIYCEQSDEDGTPDQLAKENPRFEAGVDAGGNDIIWAVDLGPATTTLAPLTTTAAPPATTTTTTAP